VSAAARRVLLVSNGFGEMAILQSIARALAAADPSAVLAHMPLVGRLPRGSWPEPVGPQAEMPSGGLVTYWNLRNIVRDVGAGLIGSTIAQWRFLARQRADYDAVVAVGDVYCAAACLWFTRLPVVFVATAKSEYVASHSAIECAIARRARVTFARDAPTARALERAGVRARYAGNVMMDGLAPTQVDLGADPEAIRVGVLPGSRGDAAANAAAAARRLERIAALARRDVQAFFAVAPSVNPNTIGAALEGEGFSIEPAGASDAVVARARKGAVRAVLARGALGDVLRASVIVLGQAGTGNEQAAGLGKPVIAAAGPGESPERVGWYRMRQRKLLGDALLVAPAADEAFAQTVVDLLGDPERMTAMAAAGRARMGEPGASAQVAEAVLAIAGTR
jgi:uncharacterized protein (TIGR03492 family)